MAYLGLETQKPTKPIKKKSTYVFPKTSADQIILDEATDERLSTTHLIKLYTHSSSGLTGTGVNGRFKCTVAGTYTSIKVNGTAYTVKFGEDAEIDLIAGVWYTFILDGTTINFNTGGAGIVDGLTEKKLNDVKKWQKCAGLKTNYTTVEQILADTATLKALINNANAMEYLIRSTTIQAAVLANANAVSILDKSMPVITPSMKSTSSPYGTVTKADGHFNTGVYKAFNYTEIGTNNSDGSAYSGQPGGWVQYNFSGDRPVWLYKSQIRPTYVNTSGVVMRMQGVLADGTLVRLSDDFSVAALGNGYNATPTPIIHKANSYKCVAVRFYVYSGGTIYFNGGKVWGK